MPWSRLRFILVLGFPWLAVYCLLGQDRTVYSKADSNRLKNLIGRIDQLMETGPEDSLVYYFHEKADLYRQKDDLAGALNTYWDLADHYDHAEQGLSALDAGLEQRWRTPKSMPEWESLLWMYSSKGYLHFEIGQVLSAIRALEQADRIFSDHPIPGFNMMEYVLKPLGAYLTMVGDNEKARFIFVKALQLPAEKDALGGIYNNIGLTYWNEGNNGRAIEEYQKGLSLDSLSDIRKGQLLSNLAKSQQETNQTAQALLTAKSAVSILAGIKNPDHPDYESWLSGAYFHLGGILAENESFTAARQAFEQALAHTVKAFNSTKNRNAAKIYIALGKLAHREGHYADAVKDYNDALTSVIPAFNPRQWTDQPQANLFHEENAIGEALEGKADALYELYLKNKDLDLLTAALTCHDLAYQSEKILRRVLENQSAKLLLQSYRRIRTEKALGIAHLLYRKTGDEGYLKKAFLIAERSKASLLLDNIRENLAKKELQQGDTLFSEEKKWLRYYSFYEKEYLLSTNETDKQYFLFEKNKVGAQLAAVRKSIQLNYPNLSSITEKELTFDQVEQWLAGTDSTILVEYFVGEKHLFVFTLQHGRKLDLRLLDCDESFQQTALSFIRRFGSVQEISNEREKYLQEAYGLFQLLCGPEAYPKGSALVFIPDGFLNFLPFEALLYEPYSGNWPEAPFLLKRAKVVYGYSVATLFYLRTLHYAPKNNLLAIAPGFHNGERGLAELNNSQDDLKAVRMSNKQVLLDGKATMQSFRRESPKYSILHLSTHAQGGADSLPPRIEFIDSSLYLPEIYALSLNADLVILSACETGLGRFVNGEGVLSLSRGFTFAGATSLISSLWTVNEVSTAQLFSRFYQQLENGMPKAEALRRVKLDYLNDPSIPLFRKSPFYWAGFTYYGNDGVVSLQEGRSLGAKKAIYGLLVLALSGLAFFGFRRLKK